MFDSGKIDVMGVGFNDVSFDEALATLVGWLDQDKPKTVFTPNPEFIMLARKDNDYKHIINNGDLVVADGVGVMLASKMSRNRRKLRYRVMGADLLLALFNKIKDSGHTVYFYGSAPGVAERARVNMVNDYPGLRVVGARNGYQTPAEQDEMAEEIKALKPDVLVVGIGTPKQEKWIDRWKNQLPCKIYLGVGGSLDVMAGTVKRAPSWVSKAGFEWLYRLIRQPSRIKRQIKLPVFMAMAVKERFIGNVKVKT